MAAEAAALRRAGSDGPGVVDPHVAASGAPDLRSVDAFLASLVRPGMSDEEKVLAVFHTVRRLFVHGPTSPDLAYDFHRVLHVLGTGACLSMTAPLHLLYERLGYRSRSWVHDGHHMMEVEYGGGGHCLDPHMSFYCYDRSRPRQIAAVAQLRADPSLARDAVAEGRAGPGYLLCGDVPDWFAGDAGEWYVEADGRWPEVRLEEPFGRIRLRPGERYARTWWPGAHWYRAGWLARDGTGPLHHCAEADARDAVNWPLYEPHAWSRGNGPTYYRVWGAGQLEYAPPLGQLEAELENAAVSGHGERAVLEAVAARGPAAVVLAARCPYVLTAGQVWVRLARPGRVTASVRVDDEWVPAPAERGGAPSSLARTWTALAGRLSGDAWVADFGPEVNGSFAGYRLRLELADGATLAAVRLTSHFQLNRFSLPHLVPGRNRVAVSAARYGAPLAVRYDWSEGPGWAAARSWEETFARDGEAEIEVAGPAHPRMHALTLTALSPEEPP
ncbi:MAG: hypothetical protein ABIL09_29955 [Gemmatimonadota bacterium]